MCFISLSIQHAHRLNAVSMLMTSEQPCTDVKNIIPSTTVGNYVVFYTYIRTERIRKFVIISLILNAFSYGKAQIPHRFSSKPLSMRCFHARCSFPHNLEQRQNVFARGCVENYSAFRQNFSVFVCCLQIQGISTSLHQNSLNIKEAMNNFLTHPVRIQVQNNQNRSRDSPP